MKIRVGFVSNSSSSSFLIYGVYVGGRFDTWDKDHENYEKAKALINNKMETHVIDDSGTYIGRCPSTIGDGETGKEFKESTEAKLKEILGRDIECRFISEAWFDG